MIYSGYMRPFVLPLANKVELVNDTFIILCSYFLIIFSGLVVDAQTRYLSGWPCIGLIAILITFNISIIMINSIKRLAHYCRLRYLRRQNQKKIQSRIADLKKKLESVQDALKNHEEQYFCQSGFGPIDNAEA